MWQNHNDPYVNKRRFRNDKRNFIEVQSNLFTGSDLFKDNLVLKASYDHFHKDFYNPGVSNNSDMLSRLSENEHRGKVCLEYSRISGIKQE